MLSIFEFLRTLFRLLAVDHWLKSPQLRLGGWSTVDLGQLSWHLVHPRIIIKFRLKDCDLFVRQFAANCQLHHLQDNSYKLLRTYSKTMKFSLTTKILLISAAVITTLMDPSNMVNAMVDAQFNDQAIAAQANYNSWDGAWIVQVNYGDLDRVKEQAAQISATAKKDFKVLHTFKDEKGMNALVLAGISIEDIKSMPGVIHVSPDIPVYADVYSWGIDRSDQLSLPLDQSAYSPAFAGCSVDVYVLDTGVDTQHIEFGSNGNGRVVENIWNGFGSVTDNTDGHGHGSHCAGMMTAYFLELICIVSDSTYQYHSFYRYRCR